MRSVLAGRKEEYLRTPLPVCTRLIVLALATVITLLPCSPSIKATQSDPQFQTEIVPKDNRDILLDAMSSDNSSFINFNINEAASYAVNSMPSSLSTASGFLGHSRERVRAGVRFNSTQKVKTERI